jgi:hypothetical protein
MRFPEMKSFHRLRLEAHAFICVVPDAETLTLHVGVVAEPAHPRFETEQPFGWVHVVLLNHETWVDLAPVDDWKVLPNPVTPRQLIVKEFCEFSGAHEKNVLVADGAEQSAKA